MYLGNDKMRNQEIISGWGLHPKVEAIKKKPKTLKELRELISSNALIARGNGRSYGDSAINRLNTIDMTEFNRFLHFNKKTGLVIAQAGILLKDIIDTFLPKGWFPNVTPGTKYVTLGGMVAADIHGKNHFKSGTFRKYIEWIEIINHQGKIMRCSRKENTELFLWTIGGMGLTGVIINVAFYLKKIETAWINQHKLVCKNINQTFELFESNIDSTYAVAWIDCFAKGKNLGRSVLMLGEHAKVDEIYNFQKLSPFKTFKKKNFSIPFFFPSFFLSNFSMKIFNSLKYQISKFSSEKNIVDWDTFFYPLDKILNWNKIYGYKGFAQFQCVIPLSVSRKGISEMLNLISDSNSTCFLAVLKRFGQDESNFSFPMEGYSLALDFPINKENLLLMNSLDQITVKYGGRFYLVKDSRLKRKIFKKSDARIKNFKVFRENKYNSNYRSCQSDRLDL